MPDNGPWICDVLPDFLAEHHEYLDPEVRSIRLIQDPKDVWLEVTFTGNREPKCENLDYIQDHDGPWFRTDRTPLGNANRLLALDRVGLIHACPATFSGEAIDRIQDEYEAWQARRAQPQRW